MGLAINEVPTDVTLSAANQPSANTRQYRYRLFEYTPSTGVLSRVPGVEPSCSYPGGWGSYPPGPTSAFVPGAAGNVAYAPYEVSELYVHVGG